MSRSVSGACLVVLLLLGGAGARLSASEPDALALGKTLLQTRDRKVARDMVEKLARIDTPLARQALLLHVKRKGLADGEALEALEDAPMEEKLATLLARASQASSEERVSLACIRGLALVPGEEVTRVLERLSSDWATKVKDAATRALELRGKAGLPTSSKIKEVPLDTTIGRVVQRKGTHRSLGASGGRDPRTTTSRSAAERSRGRAERYTRKAYPRGQPSVDASGDPSGPASNAPRTVPAPPAPDLAGSSANQRLATASAQEDAPENQYQVRRR